MTLPTVCLHPDPQHNKLSKLNQIFVSAYEERIKKVLQNAQRFQCGNFHEAALNEIEDLLNSCEQIGCKLIIDYGRYDGWEHRFDQTGIRIRNPLWKQKIFSFNENHPEKSFLSRDFAIWIPEDVILKILTLGHLP